MAVSKNEREVTILVRYLIKATKSVVSLVENDKGTRYYVTLNRNGNHSCSCKAKRGTCYHVSCCKAIENARIEARKAAKAISTVAQSVVVATPVAIEPVYVMSEAVRQKLAATAKPAPVVAEEPVASAVEVMKPTYRIISLGKKERYDYVAAIAEKREHKAAILGEIAEIKSRSKKDMMNAALTQNRAFSILK